MPGQNVAFHRSARSRGEGGRQLDRQRDHLAGKLHTPIVTASTFSSGGSLTQLAIYCRAGRTRLVVSGPAVSSGGAGYSISYSVNDGQPVQLAAGSPSFGTGAAFTGDVVRLLHSLPEDGHIAIRIALRRGAVQDGRFSLGGLKTVREKLAAACKWPNAVARPRN
jgi:hypothetical protein